MTTNPKTATWVNPTQATDQSGATVAWSAATDLAGIQLSFDGQPAVSFPVSLGATQADLTKIAPYTSLPAGNHTLAIELVTKEGAVSPFSNTVSFSIALVPFAPTNLVVA